MLKIFLYLIEGFIIGYFDFKFIKKDFNYYLISLYRTGGNDRHAEGSTKRYPGWL